MRYYMPSSENHLPSFPYSFLSFFLFFKLNNNLLPFINKIIECKD